MGNSHAPQILVSMSLLTSMIAPPVLGVLLKRAAPEPPNTRDDEEDVPSSQP
jgi:hypothetical protein